MGNLLFSPSGRIGPQAFMKGMLILALISALISLVGLVNFQLSQILGYVSFLLIIPLFFLLIKRSHDAGKSGWMSIVWFILWAIIWFVMLSIAGAVMPSVAETELKTAVEEAMLGGSGFGEIMSLTKELGPDVAKQTAVRTALSGIVATAIAAFLINMFNKSEPNENRFGPA